MAWLHAQGLTRRDIWAFALAAHEADVQGMAALLLHLDDDCFPAAMGRVDGHDVAGGHSGPATATGTDGDWAMICTSCHAVRREVSRLGSVEGMHTAQAVLRAGPGRCVSRAASRSGSCRGSLRHRHRHAHRVF